ncbi:sodium/hydrogen exchanger 3 [Aphanomyces invadans]|uniref:Sodium/hydrogen exchanger n=1 Tax=Aphanomyces invadans TaxID=157072 RepID=A0A024UTQ2_9STRA|nr:sodium/hydrogen exchanger 3 [Aphanomyces invadans]ETW09013.1 sodium/hydrogen exchanger 3 [Aphanomyces invadans]|eukprot:XP_008862818.1 sodium/hydrogen exchanger 3 [Aphanomyces invadans]
MADIDIIEKASNVEVLHDFGALNTLLFVTILGMCIVCAYLIKEYKFYYLPESGAAMIVGLIVGACARVFFPSRKEMDFLRFKKLLFYFFLLPPIIFEAGYSLHRKRFFNNFMTILLYAVVGTMISTFVVGFLTFYAGKMDWIAIDSSNPLEALLFGALISAVDPVATLSILGNPELNLDPLLYSLVFGESVLNDAVSIVLFNTFLKFEESGKEFSYGAIWMLLIEFTVISLESVVVGFVTGLGCALLCKNTNLKKYPKYEITMLFLFAYGSYSLAEVMKLSGIMSLFFCGITMAHYNTTNLSTTSQITSESIFQSFALVAEFFVFLYMGMGICVGQFGRWDVKFMVLAIVFCLVARLFNIFPLSWLANCQRKEKVTGQMQVVLWFAGLRGAIAFALSQDMPGANRDLYTTTTLSVVIFTTIVCGGLTEPLLKKTKLKVRGNMDMGDHEDEEYGLIAPSASDHCHGSDSPNTAAMSPSMRLRRLSVESELSYVESFWGNVDEKYMKPVFGGAPRRLSRNVHSASSPLTDGAATTSSTSPIQ